ncbi:hypothetical protein BN8_06076 [Fibrisoma limi BUZ 3]|uniref:Uncharacterized protein n=1 Tax=Fibrisoma limi BUZ 3 TaxID=1185876 RepID=I2GS15_9BACT|nr:hypothetical protein [Fibrisoma limi]CCH56693.1 hypothetical protein BN8_06076 [Fibrisoma limi BUZ 3]
MRHRLSAFFYRIASWQTLLVSLVLYALFPGYILKNIETQLNLYARKAIGPLDLLIFNGNPSVIEQMIAQYGAEGRAYYAQAELTADLAYPIVYTFLLCIVLSLVFRQTSASPSSLINLLPLVVWAIDMLENACVVVLLNTYPHLSPLVVTMCLVCTNLKWIAFFTIIATILYGLVRLAIRRLTKSRRQQEIKPV